MIKKYNKIIGYDCSYYSVFLSIELEPVDKGQITV